MKLSAIQSFVERCRKIIGRTGGFSPNLKRFHTFFPFLVIILWVGYVYSILITPRFMYIGLDTNKLKVAAVSHAIQWQGDIWYPEWSLGHHLAGRISVIARRFGLVDRLRDMERRSNEQIDKSAQQVEKTLNESMEILRVKDPDLEVTVEGIDAQEDLDRLEKTLSEMFDKMQYQEETMTLYRWDYSKNKKPVPIQFEGFRRPWLLGIKQRLWIMSKEAIGYLKEDKVIHLEPPPLLTDVYGAVNYRGLPALVGRDYSSPRIYYFDGRKWHEGPWAEVRPAGDNNDTWSLSTIRWQRKYHTFAEVDFKVYYHQGLQRSITNPLRPINWDQLTDQTIFWGSGINHLGPVLLNFGKLGADDPLKLQAVQSVEGEWTPFLDSAGFAWEMTALPLLYPDKWGLLINRGFRDLDLQIFNKEKKIGELRPGSTFPFNIWGLFWFFSPILMDFCLALGLCFMVSILARWTGYRVRHPELGERPVVPMSSRLIAILVDGGIMFGPAGFMMISFAKVLLFRGPHELTLDIQSGRWKTMLFEIGPVLHFSLFWGALAFVTFTFLEGTIGRTPGKWIMGLRVTNMDGSHCGFLRALFRRILLPVDGLLWSGFLGFLFISLNTRGRRLGDLAAKTVVSYESARDDILQFKKYSG